MTFGYDDISLTFPISVYTFVSAGGSSTGGTTSSGEAQPESQSGAALFSSPGPNVIKLYSSVIHQFSE
jgi:hypothetical protein